MSKLFVDYETFSEVELKVVGVSRYLRHPSTEILCMAYKVGDGEPKIWYPGEPVPKPFLDAVAKGWHIYSWNAPFEKLTTKLIAAPRHNFPEVPDNLWHCSMAAGRYSGLPGGLGLAGAALGLDADKVKSRSGHALMLKVCKPRKPSKKNPKTRWDEPELLAELGKYCEQDCQAEYEIDQLAFPLPDFERRVWELDRKINERGIPIDLTLARGAVKILEAAKENAFDELSKLTGGEVTSPWQVARILGFVNRRGVNIDNLQEKTIESVVETVVDKKAKRVLEIRLECRSAAAKKFKAAVNLTDEDGQCREQFTYHGAGTGRWCLTGDHEVLTRDGWVRIDQWGGGDILCWNPNEVCSFSRSKPVSFPFSGELVHIDHKRIDQISTADHTMPGWYKGSFVSEKVEKLNSSHQLPYTGEFTGGRNLVDTDALRVLVMVQADGHYTDDGQIKLKFKKHRKIERCRRLLRRAEIIFSEAAYSGAHSFGISRRHVPLYLRMFSDKTFREWIFDCNPDVFFEELELWDGSRDKRNKGGFQYGTTNKKNADIVQTFAHITGRAATMCEKKRMHDNWSPMFYVAVWANASNRAQIRPAINLKSVKHDGDVYCAETKTGFFYVRRNGKIWITGNTGRGVQPHNFKRDSFCSEQDAKIISTGDFDLCKLVWGQKVVPKIGECVKGLICAPPGQVLISTDLSGIENRCAYWLVGDEKTLQLIRGGADLYKVFATKVFDIPIEAVTSEQRQQMKPPVLAGQYGQYPKGLVAYARSMDIPMTLEDAENYVAIYRKENPLTVQFWDRCKRAASHCIKTGKSVGFGRLEFRKERKSLSIQTPSGKKIYYHNAQLKLVDTKWGKRNEIFYTNNLGKTERTYGSKIFQNIIEGIARDVLCEGMLGIDAVDISIIGHVHDSAIVLVDEIGSVTKKATVEKLMTTVPEWAEGLPLTVESHMGRRYKS